MTLKRLTPPAVTVSDDMQRGGSAQFRTLLDETAAAFNAKGVSGTKLGDIATRAGLTRQGLYQWVQGREELVFQTYSRACEVAREQFDHARAGGGSALDQIERLVRLRLDGPPVAILTEVATLAASERAIVRGAIASNLERVAALVREGIAQGSIVADDPELVPYAIEGALAWITLRASGEVGLSRRSVVEAVADWIRLGRAPLDALRSTVFPAPKAYLEALVDGSFRNEDDTREALLTAATRLFNRHGVVGASVDRIVGLLGITKGAFYHSFKSKDELLYLVLKRSLSLARRNRMLADMQGQTGLEKAQLSLHHTVHTHLGPLGPLALYTEVSGLPEVYANEIVTETKESVTRLREFVRQGLGDGTMRPHGVEAIQIAAAGMVNWLPTWLEDDSGRTATSLANAFNSLATFGLAAERRSANRSAL